MAAALGVGSARRARRWGGCTWPAPAFFLHEEHGDGVAARGPCPPSSSTPPPIPTLPLPPSQSRRTSSTSARRSGLSASRCSGSSSASSSSSTLSFAAAPAASRVSRLKSSSRLSWLGRRSVCRRRPSKNDDRRDVMFCDPAQRPGFWAVADRAAGSSPSMLCICAIATHEPASLKGNAIDALGVLGERSYPSSLSSSDTPFASSRVSDPRACENQRRVSAKTSSDHVRHRCAPAPACADETRRWPPPSSAAPQCGTWAGRASPWPPAARSSPPSATPSFASAACPRWRIRAA